MRDQEVIDSEHGIEPSSRQVDELLDERLAHRVGRGEDAEVDISHPISSSVPLAG